MINTIHTTPMETTPSGSAPTSNEAETTTATPLSPMNSQDPWHIQRRHPPEQMIGELDERVLRNRVHTDLKRCFGCSGDPFSRPELFIQFRFCRHELILVSRLSYSLVFFP